MPVVLATFGPNLPYWSMASVTDGSGNEVQQVGIAGTAPGTPTAGLTGTLAFGAVTTANPAYTTGQSNPLSLQTNGALRTAAYGSQGAALAQDASTGALQVRVLTGVLGGATMARVMSAATTNATSVKAAAGIVFGFFLQNSGAAAAFLKLYNKASAPTVGTDIPVFTIAIPAAGAVNLSLTQGVSFATGIAYAITNLVGDSDTTAVTLNQVTGMVAYS